MPESKIALVTGASRRVGIGAAVCRALAAQGHDIAFTHWQAYDQSMTWGEDSDGPAALQREIEALGVHCMSMSADLSQPTTPGDILDVCEAELGPLSVLVNNATYSVHDGYQELSADILDRTYAVNMRGTFLLTTAFVKRFTLGSGGRVISLSSGQGVGPMPGELAYAATKGAVEAFTISLAAEVAHLGITVNAVDPGITDTGWIPDDLQAQFTAESPMGRVGVPSDAARLIAFLASEDASWITGQAIHSRGGL